MLSQTRNSSRIRSSAAKKIQTRFKTRKRQQRSKASRKIQSRVRGKQTRKVINRGKNTDCSICFEPMTEDVRIALPCGHRFHKDCIRQSLTNTRGKCPNCRTVVTNIPYPSTPEPQVQPQVQLLYLESTQLIEHLLERTRELNVIEDSMTLQRQLLPDAPEIPNITYERSVFNEVDADDTEKDLIRINHEILNIRTNADGVRTIYPMILRITDLLTQAIRNKHNAVRISNHLGSIRFSGYP